MKIAVLGATGKTGPFVVERALEAGHEVTMLARTPSKLGATHEQVTALQGDVLDPEVVGRLVQGHNAVIWLVSGPNVRRSPAEEWVCRDGTANVLAAMGTQGVRRFVAVSSWGVGDSRRRVPLFFRLFVLPFALRAEARDKNAQEDVIRRSDLEWTIVRPSRLVNRDSAPLKVGHVLSYRPWASTSRPALAAFLVHLASDQSQVRQLVEVSSTGARVRQ